MPAWQAIETEGRNLRTLVFPPLPPLRTPFACPTGVSSLYDSFFFTQNNGGEKGAGPPGPSLRPATGPFWPSYTKRVLCKKLCTPYQALMPTGWLQINFNIMQPPNTFQNRNPIIYELRDHHLSHPQQFQRK